MVLVADVSFDMSYSIANCFSIDNPRKLSFGCKPGGQVLFHFLPPDLQLMLTDGTDSQHNANTRKLIWQNSDKSIA